MVLPSAWSQPSTADEGLAIMGDRNAGNCISCHDIPAWRDATSVTNRMTLHGTLGPSLDGVGQRYSPEQLRQWVVDARVMQPETRMPPYGTTQGLNAPARDQSLLNAAQIEAVVQALARFTRSSVSTSAPTRTSATPAASSAAQLQASQDMSPVSFWVEQGRQMWTRDCVSCHALPQVVEQVPRFPRQGAQHRLVNLEDQITQCRQRVNPIDRSGLSNEDNITLGLSAYLHDAARHRPIQMTAPSDAVEAAVWQRQLSAGERLYNTRMGHMNLSCRQCHDEQVGASMRAQRITSAYPVGFPMYRISWQGMGSIDRRIRACLSGVQAQVPAANDQRLRQLELYLKFRAQGMKLEGPLIAP